MARTQRKAASNAQKEQAPKFSLVNPFAAQSEYDRVIARGRELLELPGRLGGEARIRQQHAKGRMTVLERVRVLTDAEQQTWHG